MNENIHIAQFEHRRIGIDDQIEYLRDFANEYSFGFSVGATLRPSCLNFICEGLPLDTVAQLRQTSLSLGAPLAMIVTENWAINQSGEATLNGLPCLGNWDTGGGVLIPTTRLEQMIGLALIAELIVCLGETPDARAISAILPKSWILAVGLPKLAPASRPRQEDLNSDLFFSAPSEVSLTKYRREQIKALRNEGLEVNVQVGLDQRDWIRAARKSRAVLDIPQYKDWPDDSPMRVLRGLRANRATLSFRRLSYPGPDGLRACRIQCKTVGEVPAALRSIPSSPLAVYNANRPTLDSETLASSIRLFHGRQPIP